MENKQKYFKEALADFTVDFAAGGAIKSMADKGYTVAEIHAKLDYPVPEKTIGEIVWKRFLETGVILLSAPDASKEEFAVSYEKVQDEYGRTSFRQVKTKKEYSEEYVACDFGKRMYQNKAAFMQRLSGLSERDRDYILGLPWPLETVWHKKDERIVRIEEILYSEETK